MSYIPLNIKTDAQIMKSLIKIDDLILYAQNNDIKVLGITDTNMFNSYEFYKKCTSNGIKPLIAVELIIEEKQITLYAKNYEGYSFLCSLVSKKNKEEITLKDIKNNNILYVTSLENYDDLSKEIDNLYIGIKTLSAEKEAKEKTNNIIYNKEIRYFNKEDKESLKYLLRIDNDELKEEDIKIEDTYFDGKTIKQNEDFASLINIDIKESTVHMPKYTENSKDFLRKLAIKGLTKRCNGNVPDNYKERLNYELSIIEKMNYVDYFLIVYDFVLYAKKHNILVGPGRGSAVASLVTYSLGITNIDPLKYDLIFERFLNPERITMPDIDVDIDAEKRPEIISYIIDKYGKDKTSRIITFQTISISQAIKEVGSLLGTEKILIDRATKLLKDEDTLEDLRKNEEFLKFLRRNDYLNDIMKIVKHIFGIKRNISIHAAGVVISDIDISSLIPIYVEEGVELASYTKDYIESLGFLKIDFLSISHLSVIDSTLKDMEKDGIKLDINALDIKDEKTLDIFRNEYTNGIFQYDGGSIKPVLKTFNIESFNDLVDLIAICRPGPREMLPEYIKRKTTKEKINYEIKELSSILDSTYGIIIYQEQILQILNKVVGFPYSKADIVRRAISKKNERLLIKIKDEFFENALSKGYRKEEIEKLYNQILKFAEYGFNKAHSVGYAYFGYIEGYLKANYTPYFIKNIIKGVKEKDKIKSIIKEAKSLGVTFGNIDINHSEYEFILEGKSITMPLSLINGINLAMCKLIKEEKEKSPFKDFIDFMIRCYQKPLDKKNIISLIECGAFDSLNINKKAYINNLDEIINYVSLCKDLGTIVEERPLIEEEEDFTKEELIALEFKNIGFYLSSHPVSLTDRRNCITLNDLKKYINKPIKIILYTDRVKEVTTKKGDQMMFITFSDEYGDCEGVLFPREYKIIGPLKHNKIYKIDAKVEKEYNKYKLIINSAKLESKNI